MFSINTNVASLQAQDYLQASQSFENQTINEVTSGLRIVNSGDDAAGLAIANGMRSDESVLTQGIQNASQGLNQLQIADGGMNNISQLLDRARTLATESASGTFTGDRGTLDAEFQSVIGEINRQAQAIGLNTGGTFAKNLSVFIGGGKGDTAADIIQNGSVSVNLSQSMVDAKSLGLEGVQAIGAAGTDIGPNSATSVQNILANSSNIGSETSGGNTVFYVSGPGFSGANKIGVSVDLAGVTDDNTLVTAINAAIQAAGNGGSQYATAFGNANITASLNTDSSGKTQLTFSSANAAFQVQAGDQVASALMGNFALNATVTGTELGSNTFTVGLGGGMTIAWNGGTGVSYNGDVNGKTSLADVVNALNSDSNFNTMGTAYLVGNQMVIRSLNNTSNSEVDITASAATAALGLTASATTDNDTKAAVATTGASVVNYATAPAAVQNAANIVGSVVSYPITISQAGGDTLGVNVDGDGEVDVRVSDIKYWDAAQLAAGINSALGIAAGGAPQLGYVTASVNQAGEVVLTAASGHTVALAGASAHDGAANMGFTSVQASAGDTLLNKIVVQIAGGGLANPVDLTLDNTKDSTVGAALTDLAAQVANNQALQKAGITLEPPSVGNPLVFVNNQGESFTVSAAGDSGNQLGLGSYLAATTTTTPFTYTQITGQNVQYVSSLTDKLEFSIGNEPGIEVDVTSDGADATIQDVVDEVNAAIQNTNGSNGDALRAAGIYAAASGGNQITLESSNGTNFRAADIAPQVEQFLGFAGTGGSSQSTDPGTLASAPATSMDQFFDPGGATQTTNAVTGNTLGFSGITLGSDSQTLNFTALDNNGVAHPTAVVLNASNAGTLDQALATINTWLQSTNDPTLQQITAVKEYDPSTGTYGLNFVSTLNNFSVGVGATGSGAGVTDTNDGQGDVVNAAALGAGSTVDIGNQASAEAAVTALSNATATLGNAQAAVGRGENIFNYAINLAQSQLTNTQAAESTIRDADLAAEAANLTKAQILIQAGVAALAQANSAPQQVLSLLQNHP